MDHISPFIRKIELKKMVHELWVYLANSHWTLKISRVIPTLRFYFKIDHFLFFKVQGLLAR